MREAWRPRTVLSPPPYPFTLSTLPPPLQVRLYAAPPLEITSQWQQLADVTAMYKEHMAAVGWEVREWVWGAGESVDMGKC